MHLNIYYQISICLLLIIAIFMLVSLPQIFSPSDSLHIDCQTVGRCCNNNTSAIWFLPIGSSHVLILLPKISMSKMCRFDKATKKMQRNVRTCTQCECELTWLHHPEHNWTDFLQQQIIRVGFRGRYSYISYCCLAYVTTQDDMLPDMLLNIKPLM